MTTPQSLTEEQIELLASLPINKCDMTRAEQDLIDALPFGLTVDLAGTRKRTVAANTLLATLQSERERERERVNGLAAEVANRDEFFPNFGADAPEGDEPWTVHWEDAQDRRYQATGDTFVDALESAANLNDSVGSKDA